MSYSGGDVPLAHGLPQSHGLLRIQRPYTRPHPYRRLVDIAYVS